MIRISAFKIFLLSFSALVFLGQPVGADDLADLIEKGNTAFDRNQYDKALGIYQDALAAAPKEATVFYNKANIHYIQEDYEEAVKLYEEAINNNPAKILLKNIYFNKGNSHFKLAAEKSGEQGEDIAALQAALAEYENSFAMYRNSLELEREISIAEGWDIHQAGVYAKKNWALARGHWTRTWEKIRELEKKNLKIEDAINNLLIAQVGLLPTLERIYLASFSEDSLQFGLKNLVQYHLDYQGGIIKMRQLATEGVEEIAAEIANLKSAAQQTPAPGSAPGSPAQPPLAENNPELTKLEEEKENLVQVQAAVDRAAELEEWAIDSLKQTQPMVAWQHSRLLIDLLEDLNGYLKKDDPLHKKYLSIKRELRHAESLLTQATTMEPDAEQGGSGDVKSRLIKLGQAKITVAAQGLEKINLQLERAEEELAQKITAAKSAAAPHDSGTANESGSGVDQDQNKTQLSRLFEEISLVVTQESLVDLKERNATLTQQLTEKGQALQASLDSQISTNPENPLPSLKDDLEKNDAALARYLTLYQQLSQLIALEIKKSEGLMDQLSSGSDSDPQDTPPKSYAEILASMEIVLFKYGVMKDRILEAELEELEPLKKAISQNFEQLTKVWQDFSSSRDENLDSQEALKNLLDKVTPLRESLLANLLGIQPDLALALYFERVVQLADILVELLPATSANQQEILTRFGVVAERLGPLGGLLQQYLTQLEQQLEDHQDQDPESPAKKSWEYRKRAALLINRAASAGRDGKEMVQKENFLKVDLLFKEMVGLVKKSQLAFQKQPDKADKVLEEAIKWQQALKEQSRAASAIEASEGQAAAITHFLSNNQSDVMELAGMATAKIREMLTENAAAAQAGQAGSAAQPTAPTGGPEPASLEEAIGYIQEALIEAEKNHPFLKAGEFDNTMDIHDQVITLLEKALETLQKGKKDQGDQCPLPKPGDEQQDQQGKQGDQENNSSGGAKKQAQPLELSPEEARALLNQLNQEDQKKIHKGKPAPGDRTINTPRPW